MYTQKAYRLLPQELIKAAIVCLKNGGFRVVKILCFGDGKLLAPSLRKIKVPGIKIELIRCECELGTGRCECVAP